GTGALRQPGDGLTDVDRLTTLAEAVDPAADLTGGQRDPGSHLGLDEAGRHRVDGDAAVGDLRRERQGLHHADDACLAGGVVGLPAVARDATGGRDRDDAAAVAQTAFASRVEQHLVDPQLADEVDGQDAAPAVGVGVGEQLVAGDAGVVHEDVEPAAVALGQVRGDPLAGVRSGDVEL